MTLSSMSFLDSRWALNFNTWKVLSFNVCLHVALLRVLTPSAIKASLSVVFEVSIERPVVFISPSECHVQKIHLVFYSIWDGIALSLLRLLTNNHDCI